MAQPQQREFKCPIIGDIGVGKSSFVLQYEEAAEDRYLSEDQKNWIYPIVFGTTIGPLCFNVWDSIGPFNLINASFFNQKVMRQSFGTVKMIYFSLDNTL